MADDRANKSPPPVNRSTVVKSGRLLPPNVVGKSLFQKVLDDKAEGAADSINYSTSTTSNTALPTTSNPVATREAVKPLASQQERQGREKEKFEKNLDRRKTDREEKRSGDSVKVEGPRAKEAEHRVIARSSVSQHKGGEKGGGGQKSGSGQNWRGGQQQVFGLVSKVKETHPETVKVVRNETVGFQGMMTSSKTKEIVKNVEKKELPEIPKAVLDELVQYCRIVVKTNGDREFDMQLHQEVFKGLRLKVALSRGKIQANFLAPNKEIRDFFLAQKSAIHDALTEKGIAVESIHVMLG